MEQKITKQGAVYIRKSPETRRDYKSPQAVKDFIVGYERSLKTGDKIDKIFLCPETVKDLTRCLKNKSGIPLNLFNMFQSIRHLRD